ncbi:MAG: VRR-NUC domain-containing protein [bacterium]
MRLKATETEIKRTVKEYLILKGWFHFPLLQGIGSYKGLPDIIACKDGKVLFIEVKTEKGKQTAWQRVFQERIEKAGCRYVLVRGIEDLQKEFDKKREETNFEFDFFGKGMT